MTYDWGQKLKLSQLGIKGLAHIATKFPYNSSLRGLYIGVRPEYPGYIWVIRKGKHVADSYNETFWEPTN